MVQDYSIRTAEGKWLKSSLFREEALAFKRNGYYCPDPWGTPGWGTYWEEQLKRCEQGYEIGGHRITGHHYMYLNFCQIQVVEKVKGKKASRKTTTFPDFWDGDYDYFWSLEIAKNGISKEDLELLNLRVKPHPDHLGGGYHMIVGKSRRKGYSYKNGAICANLYNTKRKAQVIIGAHEKKFLYPKGTMGMTSDYLNFLNEHTGWRKSRDYVDKQDHKKASYKQTINGIGIESGYQSEVFALTFQDNPDAARGKDAVIVLLEEAGSFPNMKASFSAIKPALTSGTYITGQIVIFGTGGDMESGTVDFADMFYDPVTYDLMPFINIWDDNAENSVCGFFHPLTWNLEGFYDEQGNSDIAGATEWEMKRRATILKSSSGTTAYQQHIQEFALKPSEAFLTVSVNDFPVVELRNQLNRVQREGLTLKKGTPVELSVEEGKVRAKASKSLNPILHYKVKQKDLTSCPIIFEWPISTPPKGLYKIGFDPYRQDQSNGVSLAAIYVYKGVQKDSGTRDIIVASYVGRAQTTDSVNRIAEMLAELYNAEIMYENEVPDVKKYFERRKKLHLLAAQPDGVISKNIKNSKVARVYGCHMNDKLKDAGAKYIKKWLLTERDFDENGDPVTNIDYIYDMGLLEELVLYNKKGNFDRVMALMQVMFQMEEDDLDKVYEVGGTNKAFFNELEDLRFNLFKT